MKMPDAAGQDGPASRQRRLVHFSGTVQGVGFRYTATRLADRYDVAGYVKNLPDGRVEILVEGPGDQIDRFLRALRDRMGHCIRGMDQDISEAAGRFTGFNVRF